MSEKWEDRIHESIEEWEPHAGAKERMLANIRRKAAEQNAMRADQPMYCDAQRPRVCCAGTGNHKREAVSRARTCLRDPDGCHTILRRENRKWMWI